MSISHAATEARTAQRVVAILISSATTTAPGAVLQAGLPSVPSKAYGVLPIRSGVGLGFAIGACDVRVRRRFIRRLICRLRLDGAVTVGADRYVALRS